LDDGGIQRPRGKAASIIEFFQGQLEDDLELFISDPDNFKPLITLNANLLESKI
jgi:hypothetical protein